MKHYIIAKFNEGCEWKPMIGAITELFEETLQIPGVHAVTVKPCCINRPNRYDIMIEMEMDPEALTVYDACEAHKKAPGCICAVRSFLWDHFGSLQDPSRQVAGWLWAWFQNCIGFGKGASPRRARSNSGRSFTTRLAPAASSSPGAA
jgi:hypothetical protein